MVSMNKMLRFRPWPKLASPCWEATASLQLSHEKPEGESIQSARDSAASRRISFMAGAGR